MARAALLLLLLCACVAAQDFTQRGFLETDLTLYPDTAPNDSGQAVGESLLRYTAAYKVRPWLRLTGTFDARFDTHHEDQRAWRLDWQDRALRRPAFSLREFNATLSKGRITADFGKQFIRWGKADILNPTDRFAPKDYLSVTDSEVLAVTAARVIYDDSVNSIDLIWQPLFTPSRTPLLNQRWTALPASLAAIPIYDFGSHVPGRSAFGARWNRNGSGYELSLSYYDGFNHLPLIEGALTPAALQIRRFYPALRLYGADAAVPFSWFTVKTEAAYYTSPDHQQDEYVIYVLQFERQIKELSIVAGYAGSAITAHAPGFQFSPDLGFARAVLLHSQYTIDATRSLSADAVIRQNGQGVWLRGEYSETFGQHWRATIGYTWIHGASSDFLGEYWRNSFALLGLRYSF